MSSVDADLHGVVQRNVQPDAPAGECLPSGRGPDGRFLPGPGNRWGLKHGGRSQYVRGALMPEQAEALAAIAGKRAAILADLGDDVSMLKADLVRRYLEADTIAAWLGQNLIEAGLFTSKGRTRAAFSAWLQVVDRVQRLALTLGLERRAKEALTLSAYLQGRYGSSDVTPAADRATPTDDHEDAPQADPAAPVGHGDAGGHAR